MFKITGFLLIISLSLGSISSCSSQKGAEAISTQQVQPQKLYLMLRLAQRGDTNGLRIVNMEKNVISDSGHPLPLHPDERRGELFRCEVLDANQQVIGSKEVKAEFTYGTPESGPEAIVKFIFPISDKAVTARVSRQVKSGVWQEITTTSIDR